MAFKPRMTSRIEGIQVLEDLHWRAWNGVIADVWHADCAAGARGEYVSRDARLFVVLEQEGGHTDMRLSPGGSDLTTSRSPQHASFVPANVPLWSRMDSPLRLRHLDLHFDAARLSERLGEDLDLDRLSTPRLGFTDPNLMSLAHLIAAECTQPGLHHELYGDGLTVALFIDLLRLGREPPRTRTPLSPRQVRRVTGFIEENCLRSIRLQELADLTDLSQSYFSHAFKAATGMPPFQWHMRARIRRVEQMLRESDLPLTEIAVSAGFADQAHFTRVFRRVAGQTPAAWRRARKG